jgi:hypothetical protein
MDGFSIWHLITVLLIVSYALACAQILRRLGFSGWWATVSLITPLNVAGLIVLALVRWPLEERATGRATERSRQEAANQAER